MINSFVIAAVREVFKTMAQMNIDEASGSNGEETPQAPMKMEGITGGVSFTGRMTGTLYLNISDQLAKNVASRIMGGDTSGLDDDVINDVVGELTNMVTGNVKSRMTDQGYGCVLSIPSVIRGKDFTIDSPEQDLALNEGFKITDSGEEVKVCVFARLEE